MIKINEYRWVGLLGDQEGDVLLSFFGDGTDDATYYRLDTNQARWLYEQLGAFCR